MNLGGKIEDLWWKLLVSILVVCGGLIVLGFLYSENSSCGESVWDCFEFEIIMLGGGILLFSIPIVIILIIWEVAKKIKKKKEEAELLNKFKYKI